MLDHKAEHGTKGCDGSMTIQIGQRRLLRPTTEAAAPTGAAA